MKHYNTKIYPRISGNFVQKNLFAKYRLLWHPTVIYIVYEAY